MQGLWRRRDRPALELWLTYIYICVAQRSGGIGSEVAAQRGQAVDPSRAVSIAALWRLVDQPGVEHVEACGGARRVDLGGDLSPVSAEPLVGGDSD